MSEKFFDFYAWKQTPLSQEDSIAAALHYFIRKLGWNPDNLLTLSESIHKYIDKNLKGELS